MSHASHHQCGAGTGIFWVQASGVGKLFELGIPLSDVKISGYAVGVPPLVPNAQRVPVQAQVKLE